MLQPVHLIGYASGIAAADAGCKDGPKVLQHSPFMAELGKELNLQWDGIFAPKTDPALSTLLVVTELNTQLANAVAKCTSNKQLFTVFGGDHSCAIGTWSGVRASMPASTDLGLIWIDAHLDSHTPETSLTGNIHGMPLACLLGFGHPDLITILGPAPKIKPQHLCVIGARSYEAGEEELLKRLNVRVYFMEEVEQRGLSEILAEAIEIVTLGTAAYGVTIDIDSIDPIEAPGTGVSESGGLSAKELSKALCQVANDKRLIGIEIVEFDPHLDKDQLTEKLVPQLLAACTLGKLI